MGREPSQPFWWRIFQPPLFLASAVIAAWVSFTQQRQLGGYVGWDSPWGLPAIIDAAAAATLIDYMSRPSRFNRAASATILTVSAIANGLAHWYDPNPTVAPAWVAIAWGVVPPVFVFFVAHYIAEGRQQRANTGAGDDQISGRGETVGTTRDRQPSAAGDLGTRPPTTSGTNGDGDPPRGDRPPHPPPRRRTNRAGGRRNGAGPPVADLVEWLTAAGYHPGDIGRSQLTKLRPDITEHRARQVVAAWTNGGER